MIPGVGTNVWSWFILNAMLPFTSCTRVFPFLPIESLLVLFRVVLHVICAALLSSRTGCFRMTFLQLCCVALCCFCHPQNFKSPIQCQVLLHRQTLLHGLVTNATHKAVPHHVVESVTKVTVLCHLPKLATSTTMLSLSNWTFMLKQKLLAISDGGGLK